MNKYYVRDEGISVITDTLLKPFNFGRGVKVDIDTIKTAYNEFKEGFKLALEGAVSDIPVEFMCLESQLNKASIELAGKNVISLDSMYKCSNNIRMSRVYKFGSGMTSFEYLDFNGMPLDYQVGMIPKGVYTLVDDDSVAKDTILEIISSLKEGEYLQDKITENKFYSKNSMMNLISKLPKRIIIDDVYLLAETNKDAYDVVDLRDFIFGMNNSGLKVDNDGSIVRVPYISKFINLTSRASINHANADSFSRKICELNYNLFSSIDRNLQIADLSQDFQRAIGWHGFGRTYRVLDACNYLRKYESTTTIGG